MADEEEQPSSTLSKRDAGVLNHVRRGLGYRSIGEIFGIRRETAQRWVSIARRHFAEMHHLPLETLHLDKRPPGRGPELSDKERELLNEYFSELDKPLSPDLVEKITEGVMSRMNFSEPPEEREPESAQSKRYWSRYLAETPYVPPKRQR
jgi:hypothetical protein